MITPQEGIGEQSRIPAATTRESELFRMSLDKPYARVSWGAIFAGALTAVATLLILSLVGVGVGLSTLNPATGDNPSGTAIGTGAILWWVVSSLVSLFVGGYVTGRMAGNFNGLLHGLVTWSAVTLCTLMLLGSAVGRILSGATGLAQFAAEQASGPAAMVITPQQAQDALNRLQGAAANPANRAEAERQARETGQEAVKGGARGAFGAALASILGAGAACFGGVMGKRRFLDVVPERKDFLSSTRL